VEEKAGVIEWPPDITYMEKKVFGVKNVDQRG
jgi:hypothetical protein